MSIFKSKKVEETIAPVEEWVWVDGYKGTDGFMRCRDTQYELGDTHNLADGETPIECQCGFHLCLNLRDVFAYYPLAHNNRFFKVKALVRKIDVERYYRSDNGYYRFDNRKLAAKSIIFEEEVSDEELYRVAGITDWSDEHKKLVRSIGIDNARTVINIAELMNFGYSETFAKFVIESGKYDTAKAVGSQPELSMDMKAWLIFK